MKMEISTDQMTAAQTTQLAMNTVMSHKVFGRHAEGALLAASEEITRIEQLLSRFIAGSEISRINRLAGSANAQISYETYRLLTQALAFSRMAPGCFDVTVAPLVSLWGSHKETRAAPDAHSIKQTLALVDYRDLLLDDREISAGLKNPAQSIDLGGIGKGYAGDRVREIFQEFGVTSAYSNLGGNVVILGTKPDGSYWRIGIQHPRLADKIIGSVAVVNKTVSTSGDYQRYFIDGQGIRRHHILNPATGYPAESGLVSVSVITESSTAADAFSTILFVAGLEKGFELIREMAQIEAIFIDAALHVSITSGLQGFFRAAQGIEVTVL
jgi:thiamine biosynthesis lipoprotein